MDESRLATATFSYKCYLFASGYFDSDVFDDLGFGFVGVSKGDFGVGDLALEVFDGLGIYGVDYFGGSVDDGECLKAGHPAFDEVLDAGSSLAEGEGSGDDGEEDDEDGSCGVLLAEVVVVRLEDRRG